jgi:hypothetical protein
MQLVKAAEAIAARRRFRFSVRLASNGIDPATGENGQQPQISVNDGAFTSIGIAALVHVGNGWYYADADTTVLVAGNLISARYKQPLTVETPARDEMMVVSYDPYNVAASIDTALSATHGGGDWTGANKLVGVAPADVPVPISDPVSAYVNSYFQREFIVTGGSYADSTFTAVTFAIKRSRDNDDDSQALVMIRKSNPPAGGDGMIRLNGATPAVATNGSLAVTGVTGGLSIVVTIQPAGLTIPPSGDTAYQYEIARWKGLAKEITATGDFTALQSVVRNPAVP